MFLLETPHIEHCGRFSPRDGNRPRAEVRQRLEHRIVEPGRLHCIHAGQHRFSRSLNPRYAFARYFRLGQHRNWRGDSEDVRVLRGPVEPSLLRKSVLR